MNKLSPAQLAQIAQQFQQTNPHQALEAELLDHIASLIEQRMDQGLPFPIAVEEGMQQVNAQAMAQLKQLYLQELRMPLSSLMPTRARIRRKRRPVTSSLQHMLLLSIVLFLLLIGFLLVVSRPLAIPMDAFRTAWGAGGVASLLLLRWGLIYRLQKEKRPLTT